MEGKDLVDIYVQGSGEILGNSGVIFLLVFVIYDKLKLIYSFIKFYFIKLLLLLCCCFNTSTVNI